ncbi:hypothetical protein ALP71_01033 [Pseudomonas coronafaciens pv. garcae]|nr:hypothetical protein ALP71_01033 [Pseudomonas coronafaciens pv. garcae]
MQVALMKSRYTTASAQRKEVTKPKDPAQDHQSIRYRHHEDISPASRPYRRQCQFSSINLPCGQPASRNISTVAEPVQYLFTALPIRETAA